MKSQQIANQLNSNPHSHISSVLPGLAYRALSWRRDVGGEIAAGWHWWWQNVTVLSSAAHEMLNYAPHANTTLVYITTTQTKHRQAAAAAAARHSVRQRTIYLAYGGVGRHGSPAPNVANVCMCPQGTKCVTQQHCLTPMNILLDRPLSDYLTRTAE